MAPQPRNPEDVAIGQRVRSARVRSGLSREEVDARLPDGLKFKTYGAIERGDRKIRPHEWAPLAEALGVTVEYLTEDPKPAGLETDLAAVLQEIKDQLLEQTRVLNEIKAAVATEEAARRDLLAAVAVAGRVLRDGALRPVEAPESPTT